MQSRHRTKLLNKLDELYCNYKAEITYEELRLWYGQKVTKTIWQNIDEEFKNLLSEYNFRKQKYEVQVLAVNDTALLILSKFNKQHHLKPLSDLTE